MPRSNSDADENDSLTSDDEAVGPTSGPINGNADDVRTAVSYQPDTTGNEVGAEGVESGSSPPERPIDRFRSAANKIISMRRTHYALMDVTPGTEPGADPRKSTTAEVYGHIQADCKIEISEYGPSKARFQTFNNQQFIEWVKKPASTAKREIWNKVRWINIAGVSWDVISELALKYDLHPLSIEDVLCGRKNARSKADYYTQHLFVHILSHTLGKQEGDDPDQLEEMLRTDEPKPMDSVRTSFTVADRNGISETDDRRRGSWIRRRQSRRSGSGAGEDPEPYDEKDLEQAAGITEAVEKPLIRTSLTPSWRAKVANQKAIDELKKGFGRVHVQVDSVWIFLLRDGTVVSINRDNTKAFGDAITGRLRVRDTVLRASGDASLLLEGLLDLVVDNAVAVIDKYHDMILKMERSILLKPNMKTVRGLHIISGDLTLHKRTMGPISQLVYGLRRYDLDRTKAVAGSAGSNGPVVGYLSHQAKVYLADVHDHIQYIMSSLDMFSSISENLINYTFNIVSYETNQVMRRLTITTVIFFPLSFLTGYFGMNFHYMPSVQNHSEVMYWEIAFPVLVVAIVGLLWPDIQRLAHFIKKRAATMRFEQ